jgi:hypothetical protein
VLKVNQGVTFIYMEKHIFGCVSDLILTLIL